MSGVVALDVFNAEGVKYMREVFPDIIEPGHPEHDSWPDYAVGVLVGLYPITGELIRRSKKLTFIVRHGVGYDNVDVEACKEKGVILCNVPGISWTSVAEVALSLTCAAAKNLVDVSARMRKGEVLTKKSKSLYSAALLTGKTFGIVGGGNIGQATAKKLYAPSLVPFMKLTAHGSETNDKLASSIGAFDGNILMYDPFVPKDGSGPWGSIPHERVESFEEMLPRVDVLSLHLPLLPTTRDMITMSQLQKMKPTAILVNCSRGGVVNEDDLWKGLKEGVIASAGVDAWVAEPPTREYYGDALDLENLVMSPHIGGGASEIQTGLCKGMCDHMREMIDGKPPRDRIV